MRQRVGTAVCPIPPSCTAHYLQVRHLACPCVTCYSLFGALPVLCMPAVSHFLSCALNMGELFMSLDMAVAELSLVSPLPQADGLAWCCVVLKMWDAEKDHGVCV